MNEHEDEDVGAYRLDPSIHSQAMHQLAADLLETWQSVRTLETISNKDYATVNRFFTLVVLCLFALTGARPRNAAFSDLAYRISHDFAVLLPSDKAYSDMHGRRPVVLPTILRYAIVESSRLRRLLVAFLSGHMDTSRFRHRGPAGTGRPHSVETIQTRTTVASDASKRFPWYFFQVSDQTTFQTIRPILSHEALSLVDPRYSARDGEFRVQLRHFLDDAGAPQAAITAAMGHNALIRPNFGIDRWWSLRDFRDLATPYLDKYASQYGFAIPTTWATKTN